MTLGADPEEIGPVERQSWLCGLLNHYERKVE